MSELHTIQTILTALNETEDRPRSQIAAIVRTLGIEQALALLVEANEIEATGGMMLPDGSRRRTPGGVYFTLARRRLSPEDREAIFPRANSPKKEEKRDERREEPKVQQGPTVLARPDRRHVRLITPVEPVRPRTPPMADDDRLLSPSNGVSTTPSAQTSNGAAEVKLVRLDRRRIVPLPPLPPPEPPPEAPKRKPRGIGKSADRARKSSLAGNPQMHLPLPSDAEPEAREEAKEPPAPREPAQIRKRVVALLGPLSKEQKRMMLIDLLAEFAEGPKSGRSAPKKEEAPKEDPDLRGRILASVGNRLGIPVGRVASTIFGADTPANRRRVKALVGGSR